MIPAYPSDNLFNIIKYWRYKWIPARPLSRTQKKVKHGQVLDHLDISRQIEEIQFRLNNQTDSGGFQYAAEKLDWVSKQFDKFFPDDVDNPYLYAKDDQEIRAEWMSNRFEASLDIEISSGKA